MKTIIAVVVSIHAAIAAWATSIPPIPLKERVITAGVIVVGHAIEVVAIDGAGKLITVEEKISPLDTKYRVTVVPKKILAGTLPESTREIVFTYGEGYVLGIATERNRLLDKEMIYILPKYPHSPVNGLQFTESLSAEPEISGYIKKK